MKEVKLSDFTRWKKTPWGATLQTDVGGFVIVKILEKTGNEKAAEAFEEQWKIADMIDDNIVAH